MESPAPSVVGCGAGAGSAGASADFVGSGAAGRGAVAVLMAATAATASASSRMALASADARSRMRRLSSRRGVEHLTSLERQLLLGRVAEPRRIGRRRSARVADHLRRLFARGLEQPGPLVVEPPEESGDLVRRRAADGRRFLHRVGHDLVVSRAALGFRVADDPRRLQLCLGEQRARFRLGGGALLQRGRGGFEPALLEQAGDLAVRIGADLRGFGGGGLEQAGDLGVRVGAHLRGFELALLEQAGDLGVGVGAHLRGLVGGGLERPLPQLRAGGLCCDELELRGETRLPEGRDRLPAQPLDGLLGAAAPAALLGAGRLLWHRGVQGTEPTAVMRAYPPGWLRSGCRFDRRMLPRQPVSGRGRRGEGPADDSRSPRTCGARLREPQPRGRRARATGRAVAGADRRPHGRARARPGLRSRAPGHRARRAAWRSSARTRPGS